MSARSSRLSTVPFKRIVMSDVEWMIVRTKGVLWVPEWFSYCYLPWARDLPPAIADEQN